MWRRSSANQAICSAATACDIGTLRAGFTLEAQRCRTRRGRVADVASARAACSHTTAALSPAVCWTRSAVRCIRFAIAVRVDWAFLTAVTGPEISGLATVTVTGAGLPDASICAFVARAIRAALEVCSILVSINAALFALSTLAGGYIVPTR
jgi:hypothetical protein